MEVLLWRFTDKLQGQHHGRCKDDQFELQIGWLIGLMTPKILAAVWGKLLSCREETRAVRLRS